MTENPIDARDAAASARAFEREVMPHVDVAYRMARTLTRDEDQVADLVQDAALRALRAFPSLTHHDNLRSWLARIVHTTFLDRVRYDRRRPTSPIEDEDFDDAALGSIEYDPLVFEQALDDDYEACMQALPEAWRLTVQLVDVEGMSYEDAAAALDAPVGTVRSRLHRGRRRLYEELCSRLKLGLCGDGARDPAGDSVADRTAGEPRAGATRSRGEEQP